MLQMLCYMVALTVLTSITSATIISRAKRQYSNYYACGGSTYSSIGCGAYSGCGTNCGSSAAIILPSTYYASSSNCQNLCSSINCNQYNGQYVNGQYITSGYGSSQYNPCASSCCYGSNNYNNQPLWGSALVLSGNDGLYSPYLTNTNTMYGNGGNIYTPYVDPTTQVGPGPVVISTNVQRSPTAFTGIVSNGVLLCGGSEPAGGSCAENGQCPSGHFCMAGNVCCRCAVGASSGTCPSGSDSECPVGYACATTLSCCPSQHTRGSVLITCNNGSCQDGYECGKGNLCYPSYR